MTFFRPEAMAAVIRWREVLLGGALALLGVWWLVGPGRLMTIPGAALTFGGAALVWVGIQRGRFRGPGGGVGTVLDDEGEITYFGPLTGGSVSLRELTRLTLDKSHHPAHWRLDQPGQPPLMIPVNADGADILFDAFATLPGLPTERMLAALRAPGRASVVIWERENTRLRTTPLH